MRPSSKAATNMAASNRVENRTAAANVHLLGRIVSCDEMDLDYSQNSYGSTAHGELPDLPSKHLVRDSKGNRSFVSTYSG